MRLFFAGVALAIGIVVAGPAPPARACSCVVPWIGMVHEADAAFVGRLTTTVLPDTPPARPDEPVLIGGRTVRHEFAVDRVVKGKLGERVVVETAEDGAACGLTPPPGKPIGLAIYRSATGAWTSSLCSQIPLEMLASVPGHPAGEGSVDYAPMLAFGLAAIGVALVGNRRQPG